MMTTMLTNEPQVSPQTQTQPQPRGSLGRKIGCGCLIIVIILIAICGGGAWWIWNFVQDYSDRGYTVVSQGNIVVTERVTKDTMYVGGEVRIEADVDANIAAFTGMLMINGDVTGDVEFSGGTLVIGPDAVIHGDLDLKMAGEVIIEGEVLGEIIGEPGQLTDRREPDAADGSGAPDAETDSGPDEVES